MRIITIAFLLLSLACSLKAQCSQGCLACEKTSLITFKCAVCDLYNFYTLKGDGKCVRSPIENCKIGSADHSKNLCLECNSNYVLDKEVQKCVQIPDYAKVENCLDYLSLNHCRQCSLGKYILNGLCKTVVTPVQGCQTYDATGVKCIECQNWKVLKDEKCESFERADNCSLYSQQICDACGEDYTLEKNYYSVQKMTTPLIHEMVLNIQYGEGRIIPPFQGICVKKTLSNCLKYMNFQECTQCEESYFLDGKRQCQKNPYNKIFGCKDYSDLQNCKKCEPTYFLASNICIHRTMTEYCEEYEISSSVCIQCKSSHYIKQSKCVPRLLSGHIEFCEEKSKVLDTCIKCKDRFKISTDGLKCLFQIYNCAKYESGTTLTSSSLICETCLGGFYPSQNKDACHPQKVENCKAYVNNKGKCLACDPGFYVDKSDNKCLAYTKRNCAEFAESSDQCITCLPEYFNKSGTCQMYTVRNCFVFNQSEDECEGCQHDHFKMENSCYRYNLVGCSVKKIDSNKCESCISGYYLTEDKMCSQHYLPNCEIPSDSANECIRCSKGFFSHNKVCQQISIPHCLIHSNTANKCLAGQCEKGYYRDTDGYCVRQFRSNCQEYVSSDTKCSVCNTGFYRKEDYCLPQNIKNCKTYTTNSNTCTECDDRYYLDSSTKTCYVQIQEGCLNYLNKSSLKCTTCIEGYYLDPETKICVRYHLLGCKYPKPDTNECKTCLPGYSLSLTTNICILSEISFCKTLIILNDGSSSCSACLEGYLMSSQSKCELASNISNCVMANSAGTACDGCQYGYHPSGNGCKKWDYLTDANGKCAEFVLNSNLCQRCKSNSYGRECSSTVDNCEFSNGVDGNCFLCKNGYKTVDNSGVNECTREAAGGKPIAANCLGNSTTNDSTCSQCQSGYMLSTNLTKFFRIHEGCLALTTDESKCNKCESGYSLNSLGVCTKFNGAIYTLKCLKKAAGDTTLLTTNTACEECPSNSTLYKNNTTCDSRTYFIDNCGSYSADSNTVNLNCASCMEGYAQTNVKNYSMCVAKNLKNQSDKVSSDMIPNCLSLKIDSFSGTLECLVCKSGTILSSNSQSCESPTVDYCVTQSYFDFTQGLNLTKEKVSTIAPNGLKCIQNDKDAFEFVTCKSGYSNLYGELSLEGNSLKSSSDIKRHGYSLSSNKFIPFTEYPLLSSCAQYANISLTLKSVDISTGSTVSFFENKDLFNCQVYLNYKDKGYICFQCKSGFDPVVVRATKDQNGVDLPGSAVVSGVTCGFATTQYVKNYVGLSPPSADKDNFIISDLLQYDSCASGQILVSHIKTYGTKYHYNWIPHESNNTHNGLHCIDRVSVQVQVEGCHMYISDPSENPAYSLDKSKVHCGACKPGYKAVLTNNSITSCERIIGCDVSNPMKNTWMNRCETCLKGFSWAVDSSTFSPIYDACIEATAINDDCQLHYPVGTKECLLCKNGYALTLTLKCEKVDQSENGCTKMGREMNIFTIKSSASTYLTSLASGTPDYTSLVALLGWKYNNRFKENVYGCSKCSGTVPVVAALASKIPGCFKGYGVTDIFIKNCELMNGTDTNLTKCSKCKTGYSLNSAKTDCVSWDKFSYGSVSLNAAGVVESCLEDYQIYDASNKAKCIPMGECLELLNADSASPTCKHCLQGYKNDPTGFAKCIPITLDEVCLEWYQTDCIKCRNGNTPITFQKSSKTYHVICTDNKLADDNMFLNSYFRAPGTGITNKDMTPIPANYLFDITNATQIADLPNQICLSIPRIENCANQDKSFSCSKCEDGYIMLGSFQCAKGDISDCLKYREVNKCSICSNGYYSKSPVFDCKVNTQKNCEKFDPFDNKCLKCWPAFKLEPSSGSCVQNYQPSCEVVNEANGYCDLCNSGYKLTNEGTCESVSNAGCSLMIEFSGDCRICGLGYFLDNGSCTQYSLVGCEIYYQSSDKCLRCKPLYYMNSFQKCSERGLNSCLMGDPTRDKCVTCPPGSYLQEGKCNIYRVTHCLSYHPHKDECTECRNDFYFDDSMNCVPKSDTRCKLPGKYLNGCLMCKENYYFSTGDNKCVYRTKSCGVYNPNDDSCFSCPTNSYLSEDLCNKVTAKNCLVKSTLANACLSCPSNYYLKEDNNCYLVTVDNCLVFNIYSNSCMVCQSGYYLTNIGKCFSYTVKNCQVMDLRSDTCLRCESDFYLNAQMNCQSYTNNKCYGYYEDADRCSSCLSGYYLKDSDCYEYTQNYCQVFNSYADSCESCIDTAYKLGGSCIAYTAHFCTEMNPYRDACTKCQENYYLYLGTCKPYTVKNCQKYFAKGNKCEECVAGNWFRNGLGLCEELATVDNCEEYKKNFNECKVCNDGYFLENNICMKNPSGITNCVHYFSNTSCVKCKVPYFLNGNECIMSSILILNCIFYTHDKSCGKCSENKFLVGNNCLEPNNNTCKTWANRDNCATCPDNFVLDTSGSQVQCKSSGISNCLLVAYKPSNSSNKYQCTKCRSGHYLKDNSCKSTTSIDECLIYESQTVCGQCKDNFLLSEDQLKCTKGLDAFGTGCIQAHLSTSPVCSVCREGFFFSQDNSCRDCQVNGCAVCDVINLRKCKSCKKGFQMTELFYCETISSIVLKSNKEDTESLKLFTQNIVRLQVGGLLLLLFPILSS